MHLILVFFLTLSLDYIPFVNAMDSCLFPYCHFPNSYILYVQMHRILDISLTIFFDYIIFVDALYLCHFPYFYHSIILYLQMHQILAIFTFFLRLYHMCRCIGSLQFLLLLPFNYIIFVDALDPCHFPYYFLRLNYSCRCTVSLPFP